MAKFLSFTHGGWSIISCFEMMTYSECLCQGYLSSDLNLERNYSQNYSRHSVYVLQCRWKFYFSQAHILVSYIGIQKSDPLYIIGYKVFQTLYRPLRMMSLGLILSLVSTIGKVSHILINNSTFSCQRIFLQASVKISRPQYLLRPRKQLRRLDKDLC